MNVRLKHPVLPALIVALLFLAGCRGREERFVSSIIGTMDIRPLTLITLPNESGQAVGGTGFAIAPDRLVTCRHVSEHPYTVWLDGRSQASVMNVLACGDTSQPNIMDRTQVSDESIRFAVQAATADWTVLEVRSFDNDRRAAFAVDPGFTTRVGSTVYVAGYPIPGNGKAGLMGRPLRVIRGTIAEPHQTEHRDELLFFARTDEDPDSLEGMSGGPVFAVDELAGRVTAVGILVQAWSFETLFGEDTYIVARRIPSEIAQLAR